MNRQDFNQMMKDSFGDKVVNIPSEKTAIKSMEEFRLSKIDTAKKYLESQGYFTANLWHVADVQQTYDISQDDALTVLEGAMTGDWINEQIYECIDLIAEAEGHKEK